MCMSELHNAVPGKTQQAIFLSKISLQKAMWLMRAVSGPWAQLSSVAEHRALKKSPILSASSYKQFCWKQSQAGSLVDRALRLPSPAML